MSKHSVNQLGILGQSHLPAFCPYFSKPFPSTYMSKCFFKSHNCNCFYSFFWQLISETDYTLHEVSPFTLYPLVLVTTALAGKKIHAFYDLIQVHFNKAPIMMSHLLYPIPFPAKFCPAGNGFGALTFFSSPQNTTFRTHTKKKPIWFIRHYCRKHSLSFVSIPLPPERPFPLAGKLNWKFVKPFALLTSAARHNLETMSFVGTLTIHSSCIWHCYGEKMYQNATQLQN